MKQIYLDIKRGQIMVNKVKELAIEGEIGIKNSLWKEGKMSIKYS